MRAIRELGYRPNLNARALAEGRSPTLALMLSSIANPFYPEFVLAAERAARIELKALAAKLAVDGAESLLAKQLTAQVQESLVGGFVKSLEGRPN